MGGFPHYGMVKQDFVMLRGSCIGMRKRVLNIRKSLIAQTKRVATEVVRMLGLFCVTCTTITVSHSFLGFWLYTLYRLLTFLSRSVEEK